MIDMVSNTDGATNDIVTFSTSTLRDPSFSGASRSTTDSEGVSISTEYEHPFKLQEAKEKTAEWSC